MFRFAKVFVLYLVPLHTSWSFSSSSRVFVGTPVKKTHRLVRDCMTPEQNLLTLKTSTPVDEAVALLIEYGISGAPVVDENNDCLVGVISSFDFLQKEAGDGVLLPMTGSVSDIEGYVDAAKKICAQKVGDIMTPNPATMSSSATMRSATAFMSKERLHRLPIVDDGKLVGILTSSDVMQDMIHTVRNLPPASDGYISESNPRP